MSGAPAEWADSPLVIPAQLARRFDGDLEAAAVVSTAVERLAGTPALDVLARLTYMPERRAAAALERAARVPGVHVSMLHADTARGEYRYAVRFDW